MQNIMSSRNGYFMSIINEDTIREECIVFKLVFLDCLV